jgi:hypothetical protein
VATSEGREVNRPLAEFMAELSSRGIRIWVEQGRLRYRAPKGSLNTVELQVLRDSRDQIIAALDRDGQGSTGDRLSQGRLLAYRAPLGFSQLWHWNLFDLGERPSARHVVAALRVLGRLDVAALRLSIDEVVRRHDALRTQIVLIEGTPVQQISESADVELKITDVGPLPQAEHEREVRRMIHDDILQPISPARDPLFSFRLIRVHDHEHVLVVTLDHLVSDGFSMNILLHDVFAGYHQLRNGQACLLPAIPVQFAEYASWQRSALESWSQQHGRYWQERLRGYLPVRAPADVHPISDQPAGWNAVPVEIDRELRADLREWCQLRRTTLPMGVFAAYVALVVRWCDVLDLVIQFQVNSRNTPGVEGTMGYFTSILFLRLQLREDDRFFDVLSRVIEEYCRAHEHADCNYLAAQLPRPAFAHGNWFNWIPLEPKVSSDSRAETDGLTLQPQHFANPAVRTFRWDNDPEFVLFDTEEKVVGTIYFPLHRFSIAAMEALSHDFLAVLKTMLRHPEQRLKELVLPELTAHAQLSSKRARRLPEAGAS